MHLLHFYRFVYVCHIHTVLFTVHFIISNWNVYFFVLNLIFSSLFAVCAVVVADDDVVVHKNCHRHSFKNTLSCTQIKREPCQVSEITTSNSIQSIAGIQQQRRSIKIEAKSPTEITPPVINSISSSIVNMDQHSSNQVQSGMMNSTGKLGKNIYFACY